MTHSNNITNKVSEIAGKHYGDSDKTDVSLRVITDHIRSTVMMICVGVIPSNEVKTTFLRRLLRRAVRHGKLLGIDKPFMSDVASTVYQEVRRMSGLVEKRKYITRLSRKGSQLQQDRPDSGLAILNDKIAASTAGTARCGRIPALYDQLPDRPDP